MGRGRINKHQSHLGFKLQMALLAFSQVTLGISNLNFPFPSSLMPANGRQVRMAKWEVNLHLGNRVGSKRQRWIPESENANQMRNWVAHVKWEWWPSWPVFVTLIHCWKVRDNSAGSRLCVKTKHCLFAVRYLLKKIISVFYSSILPIL